ncbi:hypothetical protein M5689_016947 [Euphorbia peplus]|nr:hypothetical protein M5689_016947 [Euphorbia peplus]
MENKPCFSLIIFCSSLILLLILSPNHGCLAARKLLDYDAMAPSPENNNNNNLTYESETRDGAHVQSVYVNGERRSHSSTVRSENGQPVVQVNDHPGSHQAVVNNDNGNPQVQTHRFDNGTTVTTIYDADGNPIITRIHK